MPKMLVPIIPHNLKRHMSKLMTDSKQNSIKRSEEITIKYFAFLDQHIKDVAHGQAAEFLELNQIAKALHVSHSHLSDTLQQVTGHHPCHFYDLKIVETAKSLIPAALVNESACFGL